jgi:hypothetical protein
LPHILNQTTHCARTDGGRAQEEGDEGGGGREGGRRSRRRRTRGRGRRGREGGREGGRGEGSDQFEEFGGGEVEGGELLGVLKEGLEEVEVPADGWEDEAGVFLVLL